MIEWHASRCALGETNSAADLLKKPLGDAL
jgi:hypothetical protein